MSKKPRRCTKLGVAIDTFPAGEKQPTGILSKAIKEAYDKVVFPYDTVEKSLRARLERIIGKDNMGYIKFVDKRKQLGIHRSNIATIKNVTKIRGVPLTAKQLSKAVENGIKGLDPEKWAGVWKAGAFEFEIEAQNNKYFGADVIEEWNILAQNEITAETKKKNFLGFKYGGGKKTYNTAPLLRVIESYDSDTDSINMATCPFDEEKVKILKDEEKAKKQEIHNVDWKPEPDTLAEETEEEALIKKLGNKKFRDFTDTTGGCCAVLKQADKYFDELEIDDYRDVINSQKKVSGETIESACTGIDIPFKSFQPGDWEAKANNLAWDRILEEKCK